MTGFLDHLFMRKKPIMKARIATPEIIRITETQFVVPALGTTTTLFDVPLVDGGATADKPVVRLRSVSPLARMVPSSRVI